ncbi:MAG: acetylxylan esterase [Bacteroidetes bacterium]|nr:acetylxylan esterase [Bacteroidota bacterium]
MVVFLFSCTRVKFEVGKRNESKMLENKGIVAALISPNKTNVMPEKIIDVFGVHVDSINAIPLTQFTSIEEDESEGIVCKLGHFTGYDGVEIPFYELLPPDFDESVKYPTVILYSGHGDVDDVTYQSWSYQKGGAMELAKEGFLVYTMENRGMGMLSHLGDHLKIDAVARLTGNTWYGELITDGLYLLEIVQSQPYVDRSRIGAGGVSTGGALSMLVAALDVRISSAYVQGYLGSYKTTFGVRANHDICNNIPGILNHFDIPDIAASIAPRPAIYVNGEMDTFYYQDAETAFQVVKKAYNEKGAGQNVSLEIPKNTIHELSVDLMINFFIKNLVD